MTASRRAMVAPKINWWNRTPGLWLLLVVAVGANLLTANPAGVGNASADAERESAPETVAVLRVKPKMELGAVGLRGTATALTGELGRVRREARDRTPEVTVWEQVLDDVAPAFRIATKDLDHQKSWTDEFGAAQARFRQRKHGLEVVGASLNVHAGETGVVYAALGNARDDNDAPKPGDAKLDAAVLADLPSGASTAVSNAATFTSGGIVLSELCEASDASATGRLVNASMRPWVGTGEPVGIVAFVRAGEGPAKVLLRAVGPGLAAYGVDGVLADPQFFFFRDARYPAIGSRDRGTARGYPLLAARSAEVGAFAPADGSRDAAILVQLEPGLYAVVVCGQEGGTGNCLVEIYLLPD